MEMLLRQFVFAGILASAIAIKLTFENTDRIEENVVTLKDLFAVCEPKESLNLRGTGLTLIPEEIVISDKIQSISLANNKIKHVPRDALKNAGALLCLDLSRNYIPVEEVINFGQRSIRVLDVSYQHKESSNREEFDSFSETVTLQSAFSNFPNLLYLDLSGNEINYLPHNFSKVMPTLTHLYLRNRNIRDLSLNFFDHLPKTLKSLHLENNEIDRIYFPDNLPIEALFLDGNPILLQKHTLSSPYIKTLSLSNCSLNTANLVAVGSLALYNIPNLESLDLSRNSIDNILNVMDPTWFKYLKKLNLAHNEFTKFPLFPAATKIQKLSISHNKIRQIDSAIENFPILTELNIRFNGLNSISVDAFSMMPHLEMLDLSGNELKFMPTGWLYSLTNLYDLDLRNNHFSSIQQMFGKLPIDYKTSLRNLYIKSNVLQSTDTATLDFLPSSCVVHVS